MPTEKRLKSVVAGPGVGWEGLEGGSGFILGCPCSDREGA